MTLQLATLKNELCCPICLQQFIYPITLRNCRHAFCKECIHDTVTLSSMGYNCPLCRLQFKYSDILQDIFRTNLLNIIHKEEPLEAKSFGVIDISNLHKIHDYGEDYFVFIRFCIFENYRKWLHSYIVYTTDNWKSTFQNGKTDYHPSMELPCISSISCHVPVASTEIEFAICVYDDFGFHYWLNNNNKNYKITLNNCKNINCCNK